MRHRKQLPCSEGSRKSCDHHSSATKMTEARAALLLMCFPLLLPLMRPVLGATPSILAALIGNGQGWDFSSSILWQAIDMLCTLKSTTLFLPLKERLLIPIHLPVRIESAGPSCTIVPTMPTITVFIRNLVPCVPYSCALTKSMTATLGPGQCFLARTNHKPMAKKNTIRNMGPA